jgi:hypothetical protein
MTSFLLLARDFDNSPSLMLPDASFISSLSVPTDSDFPTGSLKFGISSKKGGFFY